MPTIVQGGQSDGVGILGWDGSAVVTANYSSAFIEVTTYGGAAITINEGLTGSFPVTVINTADNSTPATITATGLYTLPAVGNLSYSGGAGSTVNLLLKR